MEIFVTITRAMMHKHNAWSKQLFHRETEKQCNIICHILLFKGKKERQCTLPVVCHICITSKFKPLCIFLHQDQMMTDSLR